MKHARSTTRKLILVSLVVVMLTLSLGSGIASASSSSTPSGTPQLESGMWWGGACTYTVRPGDTLFGIALRFHTTVAHLASINGIANPRLIRSGRHLIVPCDRKPPVDDHGCFIRVKPGDTLFRIALRHHTTVGLLAAMNGLHNPNRIFAGQWLRVPCCDP